MTFISHRVKNLKLNYEQYFGLKKEKNYYLINPTNNIPELTVLINEETFLPVNVVNSYLIHRYLLGKTNSNFECRALRLYFDFLEIMELEWDKGSNYIHKRPLSMFGKYLKEAFEDGEISGTTAVSYFNSVSRFYKYYLTEGYKFKGVPVTFTQKTVKAFSTSLKNHINKFES